MADKFPDWFSAYAKPNFEKYLIPLAGVDNLEFLQLGVYTGDASVWLAENILISKTSRLYDVDTWAGSDEEVHKSMDFNQVFNTYKSKTDKYLNIIWTRSDTRKYLTEINFIRYNFIYIDADHTAVGVLMDAELSWPLLKSGGIMAFDDYQWGAHLPASKSPKLGIDLFLERHAGEYEVLEQGLQVWIRKL